LNLVNLANSRLGPGLGIALVKLLPDGIAYRIADSFARRVTRNQDDPLVMAIRSNQSVVQGRTYHDPKMDRAAYDVLRNALRGYVTLFRLLGMKDEDLLKIGGLDESVSQPFHDYPAEGRGIFFAGIHTAGFDQLLLWMGRSGFPFQALSYANPEGSYVSQNAIRRRFGVRLTPIGIPALREALQTLRMGGIVASGVDRRDDKGVRLVFFGRETLLPVGHVRLAKKANALILTGAPRQLSEERFELFANALIDPIQKRREGASDQEIAQLAITALEAFVLPSPTHWLMFHPVWPDALPNHYPLKNLSVL
jgi:lauroyl/myristoyl acyltransferase